MSGLRLRCRRRCPADRCRRKLLPLPVPSSRCRTVLERLKKAGYSEHVAQVIPDVWCR